MKVQNLLTLAVTTWLITPAFSTVVMDFVTVGNAGNAAQSASNRSHSVAGGDGYGGVDYVYQIGKYEVTNAQYAEFLNAAAKVDNFNLYGGVYFTGISRTGSSGNYVYTVTSENTNLPASYISWYDAARFCNWLHNGKGNGDTENGAYSILGANSGIVNKNSGAKFWIPTENEWFKAAYYNGATGRYSLYANGKNTTITSADANIGSGMGGGGQVGTKVVGSYSHAPSYYGTFDQAGNRQEWTDGVSGSEKIIRGGSSDTYWVMERSDYRTASGPGNLWVNSTDWVYGFRIATVPEPSSLVLTMLASGLMFICRKR
jgi:formylglycine-generating enzyme required for sulfatase activity